MKYDYYMMKYEKLSQNNYCYSSIFGAAHKTEKIMCFQDAQVTVECVIPQQFHRTVMGARGANVQEITMKYDVGIKFPDRPIQNGGKEVIMSLYIWTRNTRLRILSDYSSGLTQPQVTCQ